MTAAGSPGRPAERWLLIAVAGWALSLQIVSALATSRSLESPNASTRIAHNLVETGRFEIAAWTVLRGPAAIGSSSSLRAYQLPGEPLFLALGIKFAPAAMRLWHTPVAALFVTAVAAVGLAIGGFRTGAIAGVLASIDPFVLAHGPVSDDTLLAAALEWTALAIVIRQASGSKETSGRWLVVLAACAGLAAATRLHAEIVLALVAGAIVLMGDLRPLRRSAIALVAGMAIAMGIWGTRNALVLGRFATGSSHDGITLFRANYATARPSIMSTGRAEWFDPVELAPAYAAAASLDELDADRYFARAAVRYASSHPADVGRTAALKTAVSLTGVDPSLPLRARRNLWFAGWNALALMASTGIFLARRRLPLMIPLSPRQVRVLAYAMGVAVGTTTLVMLAIGPVGFRYRMDVTGLTSLAIAMRIAGVAATPRARRSVQS